MEYAVWITRIISHDLVWPLLGKSSFKLDMNK